jgi:lipopolysaccharide transport system ATP-binding protein
MFSDVAIKVDNLSKCYQIYEKPRDRLLQMLMRGHRQYYREFWALKDVSFEIKKGETVGVIGRNGSGKSTLLQMVCGTLNPTSGSIKTHGRIAALLELGSGFNPEFTGRENVYMNASVLGLNSEEIDARFDKIATFADIGDFIEQPVKTYSSGMMVRLAFAVIVHVDADILVIDEALSVGDAIFTQKCMRYIRDFQKRGTLVFVSHDMGSVLNLCKTGIWLEHGMIQRIGPSKEVAENYLHHTLQISYGEAAQLSLNKGNDDPISTECQSKSLDDAAPLLFDYQAKFELHDNLHYADGWNTGVAEIISLNLDRLGNEGGGILQGGEKVQMVIRAKAHQKLEKPILGFLIRDRLGQDLFGENTLSFTNLHPYPIEVDQEFVGEFIFRLPMLPNGEYAIMASVADGDLHNHIQHHYLHNALIFNVTSSKVRYGLVGVQFEKVTLKSTE